MCLVFFVFSDPLKNNNLQNRKNAAFLPSEIQRGKAREPYTILKNS